MKRTIEVNESSIIDLKAELFRKEETFKQQQISSVTVNYGKTQAKGSKTLQKIAVLTGRKKANAKRKIEDVEKYKKDVGRSDQDEAEYQKSKLHLQAKARLYEKMSKGDIEDPEDEEGESTFLVDFHKKVYESEENTNHDDGDDWVEFEDSLGRQRKCLRKDLDKFKSLDVEFRPVLTSQSESPPVVNLEEQHYEMQRQKWEQEKEELLRNPDRDIHYQNVLFDEVRDHGVGYYQFSKDEAERKSQMEVLDQLRDQTVEQRAKREAMKAKRQAILKARLAKVKQKKLNRQGLLPEGKEIGAGMSEDLNGKVCSISGASHLEDETRVSDEPKGSQNLDAATASGQNHLNVQTTTFESTNARKKDMRSSYSQWIKEQREDRNPDFAPPSIYDNQRSSTRGRKGFF